jgi:hypothetical protein
MHRHLLTILTVLFISACTVYAAGDSIEVNVHPTDYPVTLAMAYENGVVSHAPSSAGTYYYAVPDSLGNAVSFAVFGNTFYPDSTHQTSNFTGPGGRTYKVKFWFTSNNGDRHFWVAIFCLCFWI